MIPTVFPTTIQIPISLPITIQSSLLRHFFLLLNTLYYILLLIQEGVQSNDCEGDKIFFLFELKVKMSDDLTLLQLQNLMKRDSSSYLQEFNQQMRHFESQVKLLILNPSSVIPEFSNLVMFLAQVSNCYKLESKHLPVTIIDLLTSHAQELNSSIRTGLVKALILLRNKKLIELDPLLHLFFSLFRCNDKTLRSLLHSHIIQDIKNANLKSKNLKLNKTFQNFMYTMIKDQNEIAARESLQVMVDLYKKNVWKDQKTVNVISEACFSTNLKLVSIAIHFFLGADDKIEQESDDEKFDIVQAKHVSLIKYSLIT